MRWEIFSGWRVIFVSVCGRGVRVCVSASWCVHMLFVNVNAQAAPSWVLTDKDLMRAASWKNLTQPPTASCKFLPYYQLTATPSIYSMLYISGYQEQCDGTLYRSLDCVATVNNVMLSRCYSCTEPGCIFNADSFSLPTRLHTTWHHLRTTNVRVHVWLPPQPLVRFFKH